MEGFDKVLMDEEAGKALKECLLDAAITAIQDKISEISVDSEGYLTVNGERQAACNLIGPKGDTVYQPGTGLKVEDNKLSHSNSVTAATKGSTTTTTASATAGSIPVIGGIKYDSEGHITDVYARNITLSNTTYSAVSATGTVNGLMTPAAMKKLDEIDLSKYLPLSGGNGSIISGNLAFSKTYTYFYKTVKDGSYCFMAALGDEPTNTTSATLNISDMSDFRAVAPGVSRRDINLGFSSNRWLTVYSQDGDFSGNLTVSGKINGTNVASLITRDDLAQVLTAAQMTKIDAVVNKRIAAHEVAVAEQRAADEVARKALIERVQERESGLKDEGTSEKGVVTPEEETM